MQDDGEEGVGAFRGFLLHGREAGVAGEANFAAVDGEFAGDGAQQGGFAGAVAPDQADAAAGIDGEVGAVEQRAAAEADGDAGEGQKGHGGVIGSAWT